jgi:hypothetical protein
MARVTVSLGIVDVRGGASDARRSEATDEVRCRVVLVSTVGVGPLNLSGPALRAALEGDSREQFEADFRAALVVVTHTFDVDRLAEVVRRWWVAAGGDQAVADMDRDAVARAARLTEREWGEPRPIYVPPVMVNRTGPAVRAALSGGALVEFEAQFERALVEAAGTCDHQPVARVVSRWWAVAVTIANPDPISRDYDNPNLLDAAEFGQSPVWSQRRRA